MATMKVIRTTFHISALELALNHPKVKLRLEDDQNQNHLCV